MTKEELKQRLIDLLDELMRVCEYSFGEKTPTFEQAAKFLIANGVTIRERGEWIPVTERLPEDSGKYLVFNPKRPIEKVSTARYISQSRRWCLVEALSYIEGITHWMPLPLPPEKENEDG